MKYYCVKFKQTLNGSVNHMKRCLARFKTDCFKYYCLKYIFLILNESRVN